MEAFIGEVRAFPYNFVPTGDTKWLRCDGKTYPIQGFASLYSIIGNRFGGEDKKTFTVPDLSMRVAVGTGGDEKRGELALGLGKTTGSDKVVLTPDQMPAHTHQIKTAFTGLVTDLSNEPGSDYRISRTWNQLDFSEKAPPESRHLDPNTLEKTGGGQGHENRQPVLAVHYFICYDGEFPTRP